MIFSFNSKFVEQFVAFSSKLKPVSLNSNYFDVAGLAFYGCGYGSLKVKMIRVEL